MSKKKENVKKNNVKKGKKKDVKKYKSPFSFDNGPKLKTWLVWITIFVIGVGFLAFGDVRFYTKQRVKKVDSVPVWTTVETETVTKEFKSDSNNLKETGGYLNYYHSDRARLLNALQYYNSSTSSYTINVDDPYFTSFGFQFFPLFDSRYFQDFESDGYVIDRNNSYFLYYIEVGSNIVPVSNNPGRYSVEPGVIHSIPYSSISYGTYTGYTSYYLKRSFIDPDNKNPKDNIIKIYPAVSLRFKNGGYFYDRKSYTVFEEVETVSKKTEMVLNYEERVTYYDEFKFNLNGDQFNEVATGLFKDTTSYIGKFIDIWDVVFDFLKEAYKIVVDGLIALIKGLAAVVAGWIEGAGDLFGGIKEGATNVWNWLKDLVNINSNVIIPIYATNDSVVLRR